MDRAQPGPDEGKQPKSEKQATLNGSVFPFNVACLVTGLRPLIRHALRRATFPGGEGDLPAGLYTLSWERVAGPKALTGVGGPSLQQGDPSVSLGLTAPFTQGSLPLFRRRHPLPSVLSEGAAAGLGVEGTPTGPGRTGIKSPPPEEAFPHGEGGPGAARAG